MTASDARDQTTRRTLRSSGRWARLLATFGWIGAVVSVGMALQIRATSTADLPAATEGFALASTIIGLVTLALAAVYLGRYARHVRALLAGHAGAAPRAFRALRLFWMGLTVTSAVTFVISVVHLATQLRAP